MEGSVSGAREVLEADVDLPSGQNLGPVRGDEGAFAAVVVGLARRRVREVPVEDW